MIPQFELRDLFRHNKLIFANYHSIISTFLMVCLLMLGSCKKDKVEPLTPVNTADLLGTWKLDNASVTIKGRANGGPVNITDKRNGESNEYLEFLAGGVVKDPADIFGTSTYTWKATIENGNELTLRVPGADDYGYFTITMNGNKMTWKMNAEQAIRSSKDSDGYSSVLNGGTDDFDELKELSLVLEFTKK